MRIHLSPTYPEDTSNFIIISDEDTFESDPLWRTDSTKYLLVYINGKMTLPFFKKAAIHDNILIYAKNIEDFFNTFDEFRDFQVVLDDSSKQSKSNSAFHKKTTEIETFNPENDPLADYQYADKEVVRSPPIFQTIITSLLRPDLYLSKDQKCKEIIETIKKGAIPENSPTLKSLMIFGAVIKTEKGYRTTF